MTENISILITGDYCPINRIEAFSEKNDLQSIFNDFLPFIADADLAITNFECSATNSNSPIQKSGPSLRVNPNALNVLKDAGFGLVTLANNHIMDYGKVGIKDTIKYCEQFSLDFVGIGKDNAESREFFIKNIKGIKIAILNIAENEFGTTLGNVYGAAPLNIVQNYNDIVNAKKIADYVFVIIHGGHEMYQLPSPRMVETYRFFVDVGADAVVGHHTHCFSGYEVYKNKPIFYSIGNFMFDNLSNRTDLWCDGMALNFHLTKTDIQFELIPYQQNSNKVGVHLMNQFEKNKFYEKLKELNEIIIDSKLLSEKFNTYCNEVKNMYNSFLEPFSNRWFSALQNRNLLPSFYSIQKKKILLNVFRCEAHRDVMIKTLSDK